MHKIISVLVCLVGQGHGWQVQATSLEQSPVDAIDNSFSWRSLHEVRSSLKALTALLSVFNPSSAFKSDLRLRATRKIRAAIARQRPPVCCDGKLTYPLCVPIPLFDEKSVDVVTLGSQDDPATQAAELASRHGLHPDDRSNIEGQLAQLWNYAKANPELVTPEKTRTAFECLHATRNDIVTVDEALTPDERTTLINYLDARKDTRNFTLPDTVDGEPQCEIVLPEPALQSLAELISPKRIAAWWAKLHDLPMAALDDLEKDVPWNLTDCSVSVRHYSQTTRPSLDMHADSSKYTINVALRNPSRGGELAVMLDRKLGPIERREGTAVFHSSNVNHAVDPVEAGERITLIIFLYLRGGDDFRHRWFASL